ncbi:MAG: hypothetical protein A2Z99_01160 [Treponema sp. GWB1_62_6]|nr:MAG: hypothetical protein A2Y36_05850 [Treponema sp. GWA1_62_8]OHE64067.1 MAG: hypothetical protein A2Z99_01160 [Treponema sp. GWB1_62_6]OHE69002.1 MAG: hypothetical protein A2001_18340 [Treponema sp. GWC1_61_84]OHE69962.1 MAG: hypothetical protein A2413_00880 [Treponema sp. RIFOXYC1_FULL_61_9]
MSIYFAELDFQPLDKFVAGNIFDLSFRERLPDLIKFESEILCEQDEPERILIVRAIFPISVF